MDQLISLLADYHLYLMGIVMILALVLPKGTIGENKPMLIIAILIGLSIVYELAMDEPVTQMPGRLNRTLNDPGSQEKTNPQYWVEPEDRYDSQEHDEMIK